MRIDSHEQALEIYKCATDIGYFARNYVWIRHPAFPFPIRFVPWRWQLALMYLMAAGFNVWILKSRQVGFSWCLATWANWRKNFRPEVDGYYLSANLEKATSLMRKDQFVYDRMPDWLRASDSKMTRTKISHHVRIRYRDYRAGQMMWGTSRTTSLTTTGVSGAGESASFVGCDEVALWKERQDDMPIWASIAPTVTHGGQIVGGSTPRGYGGVFHKVWVDAITPMMNEGVIDDFMDHTEFNRVAIDYVTVNGGMLPFMAHYSMCYHDEEWIDRACDGMGRAQQRMIREYFTGMVYDEEWRDRQARETGMPMAMVLQEHELDFARPGDAAFDSAALQQCWLPRSSDEFKKLRAASKKFYGGVDTSIGGTQTREPDYNSITFLNDRGVQVFAEHNRHSISEWAGTTEKNPVTGKSVEIKGDVLREIERHLPCKVVIEQQGRGGSVFNRVYPHRPSRSDIYEIFMSSALKPRMVSDFALAVESQAVVITDYFTLECLRQFIHKGGGKYEAAPGFYDDPVISILWAYYLLKQDGYYNLNLGRAADERDKRMIAISPEDDLEIERAELLRQGGGGRRGPMYMTPEDGDIAAIPSDAMRRPFGARGRRGRGSYEEGEDRFDPRSRRRRR